MFRVTLAAGALGFGALMMNMVGRFKKQAREEDNKEAKEDGKEVKEKDREKFKEKDGEEIKEKDGEEVKEKKGGAEVEEKKEQTRKEDEEKKIVQALKYWPPGIYQEIWSIWHEPSPLLKTHSVDLKMICGHILARSINFRLKNSLFGGVFIPDGVGVRPMKGNFACAIRLTNKDGRQFFEIFLAANGGLLLCKKEKQYLGKWRAYPLGTRMIGSDMFVMWKINQKPHSRIINLKPGDKMESLCRKAERAYRQNVDILSAEITQGLEAALPRVLIHIVTNYVLAVLGEAQISATYNDLISGLL